MNSEESKKHPKGCRCDRCAEVDFGDDDRR